MQYNNLRNKNGYTRESIVPENEMLMEIKTEPEAILERDEDPAWSVENSDEILKKINEGEYRILKKTGRSIIWSVFSEIQKSDGSILQDRVYCQVCHKLYKFVKTQTSNLIRHKCLHSQPQDSAPIQINNEDGDSCFEAFMDFSVEDCRPFCIVEGSGFRKMIFKCIQMGAKYGDNLDLDSLIPTAMTLSRKSKLLVAEKREEIKPLIQNLIDNSEAAVTINMWTDDFIKRHFLSVTLHYQVNFRLVYITLGIKSMDFMYNTAVNIRQKLNTLFEEFGVTDLSKAIFVTDYESNIVSALKDLTRLNCSAHLFSNVLNDAFESTNELKEITYACKKIVKYLKKSNKQHMLHTTLKNRCATKWNSNFAMYKLIFDNYIKVNEILEKSSEGRIMLNFNMSVLQGLVGLYNDFEIILKKLQTSLSPTFCYVVPSINKIKMICVAQNNEEAAIATLKINILSHLEKWNSNLSILHKAALFLYPPAISLQLNEIKDIKEFCITKINEIHTSDSFHFSASPDDILSPAVSGSPISPLSPQSEQQLSSVLLPTSSSTSAIEPANKNASFFFPTLMGEPSLETGRDEVERYCNECVRLTDEFDEMLWWRNNSRKYPKLSQLAMKLLIIPASAAASEHVCSLAGNIIIEKRNQLETKTVNTPKPKRKRLGWNEGSEAALLNLWPERLEELRGQRKNGHIYANMAEELSKLGYTYSPRDVQVKLQNFTQRYRKDTAAMAVSGGSPSTWPLYSRVHQIIGGIKANLYTELALESIDDPSIASSLSSPPSTPMPAPSSPLPLRSPSRVSSTPASALRPVKKKKVSHFQATVWQKFENLSTHIAEHLKKSEENERKLIEIEKKKADSLEKIAKDSEELKNALISFLNKN